MFGLAVGYIILSIAFILDFGWFWWRDQTQDRLLQNLQNRVSELEERLQQAEVWSSENPTVLLSHVDGWIEEIRQGSSRVSVRDHVLPTLKKVCDSTDTKYWRVLVSKKLEMAEDVVRARSSDSDELLKDIAEIKDNNNITSLP